MNKNIILKGSNLGVGLPITSTIASYLLLDKIGISQIWWGVYIAFMAMLWIARIYLFIKTVWVDKHAEIKEDGSIEIS